MSRGILILIKGLGRGGAEQLLVNGARHLDHERFRYEVAYLLPWKDALVGELREVGLTVHCLHAGRGPGWLGRLRALVRERRFDLVHAHLPVAGLGPRIAFGRERPRLVYTEHNVWPSYHRLTYAANMLTLWRNDHVFAVSDEVRRSMSFPRPLRFLPVPPIETLHHGIDLSAVARWGSADGVRPELRIPDGAPLVGTVANFRPDKGHRYLVEAASRVREAVPDVRFVFVGHGGVERDVRAQVAERGLEGTVVFAGYREDAPRVAGAFDLFVLPSIHEGLPISLLEGMVWGTPAVVTRVGGNAEVVEDGVQGRVVPPRDPGALAEAITALLTDDAERRRMGEAARRRAERFDMSRAVRRMEEVYASLLERQT